MQDGSWTGAGWEQDRSRMGTGQEVDESRMGAGQELDGNRIGAGWELDGNRIGAGWELDRSWMGARRDVKFDGNFSQLLQHGSSSKVYRVFSLLVILSLYCWREILVPRC